MEKTLKYKLEQMRLVGPVVRLADRIRIFEDLTLYELMELYITGLGKSALGYRARAIAFSFFMSLFPFALFILNLIPYIPIPNFQQDFLRFVEESVPPNTYDAIYGIINDILNQSYGSLLSTGFLLSIILQANGINALLETFENALDKSEKRPFFRQYLIAIGMAITLNIILILTVGVIVVFEVFVQQTRLEDVFSDRIPFLQFGRYLFVVVMILSITSILFKFGTKQVEKRAFISVGSVFTTLLFVLLSYFFGIWVVRFSRYNELYGSIGTLLVIMFYIWVNCAILLLGFELNTIIDHHKRKIRRRKERREV